MKKIKTLHLVVKCLRNIKKMEIKKHYKFKKDIPSKKQFRKLNQFRQIFCDNIFKKADKQ